MGASFMDKQWPSQKPKVTRWKSSYQGCDHFLGVLAQVAPEAPEQYRLLIAKALACPEQSDGQTLGLVDTPCTWVAGH